MKYFVSVIQPFVHSRLRLALNFSFLLAFPVHHRRRRRALWHPQPQPRALGQGSQRRGQRDPGQDVVRRHRDQGDGHRRGHQADGQGLSQLLERE